MTYKPHLPEPEKRSLTQDDYFGLNLGEEHAAPSQDNSDSKIDLVLEHFGFDADFKPSTIYKGD